MPFGNQAMHFDRDDINLPGFHKFFKESAEEEMEHAQKVCSGFVDIETLIFSSLLKCTLFC